MYDGMLPPPLGVTAVLILAKIVLSLFGAFAYIVLGYGVRDNENDPDEAATGGVWVLALIGASALIVGSFL